MKRLMLGLALLLVGAFVLATVTVGSAESSSSHVTLKASPTRCHKNASVKFTATVKSNPAPYEVRIYRSSGGSWTTVATASQSSKQVYVAYVTASSTGKVNYKAGLVDSKGRVFAYSNVAQVTVVK